MDLKRRKKLWYGLVHQNHYHEHIFKTSHPTLAVQGLLYERKDFERPWGGFLDIRRRHQSQQFSDQLVSGLDVESR